MLLWMRETYAATATDGAASLVTHLITPDGTKHDPTGSGAISRRQLWRVHRFQVFVLATTTGYMRHGSIGALILPMDYAGSWMPLPDRNDGLLHPNYGLVYDGAPFYATHGLGWAFWKGVLQDTDKVYARFLYEVVKDD